MVGALLEAGVAPEDISIVIKSNGSMDGSASFQFEEGDAGLAMVDSGEGGASRLGHSGSQTEGSFVYESRIGAGISTSSPDDDVSKVDEMDDSQTAAEEMSYPASAQSYSSQDRIDAARATRHGYFRTTEVGGDGLGLNPSPPRDAFDSGITSVIVPHFALVLGDGPLATAVMGAGVAAQRAGTPAANLQDYLEDQGVPHDLAFMLAKDFEEGGAVLAVAAPPGGIDSEAAVRVLEDSGALNVQLVDAVD